MKMKTCGRCRFARYCSKQCQKADWPEHKLVCSECQDAWKHKTRRRTEVQYGVVKPDMWVQVQTRLRVLDNYRTRMAQRNIRVLYC